MTEIAETAAPQKKPVNSILTGILFFIVMSIITGVIYTALITGIAQLAFPSQANGSLVQGTDGKTYTTIIGQDFHDDTHMWGRLTSVNTTTFTDDNGNPVAWYGASNLSPAGEAFEQQVQDRIAEIKAAHPEMGDTPIPSDLVTGSGSGLDPDISPAAAEYQVDRLVRTTGKSESEIRDIIARCTEQPTLGFIGDPRVNVVKVNLMLDGLAEF